MCRAVILAAALLLAPSPALADDKQCLAEAMYFEARDQGWRGMLAVGIVIQNRVKDPRYPDDACGVVRQGKYRNGNPIKHRCQFSYYCDGKPERPSEKEAWRQAVDIAALLTTTEVEMTGLEGATHYHADWVKPSWSRAFERRQKIGSHIFYAQK
jgi:spore germination cell wall hydrolase CwlJ-like protein|tara:strand:+ start:400 stop:864 length:465 start_codon:yes stop_codon:yes gene_type:complete